MSLLFEWGREEFATYGPKLVTGILTLVLGWLAAKLIRLGLRHVLKGARLDATAATFCANLAYVTMLTLVVTTALDKFGFPAISLAAVVGAAGLAIGLALKGTLSNFAAGVILIALRPFKVGDRIDAAGVSGQVTEIRVFATTLAAENGKKIIVPNAAIAGGNIANYSAA